MKTSGGLGPILLARDTQYYLARPVSYPPVTVSMWLRYASTGVAQTFLAAGDQENQDRGIHLHQEDGSREELTFSVKVDLRHCLVKFEAPQRVWTHLIFAWQSGLTSLTAYRDGKLITNFLVNNCHSGSFADLPSDAITIGSSTLPTASIDDLMVLQRTLSLSQVEKFFRYYKGKHELICTMDIK